MYFPRIYFLTFSLLTLLYGLPFALIRNVVHHFSSLEQSWAIVHPGKICDVQPFLLSTVLYLRLLFGKLFMVERYLLSLSEAILSAPTGTCPT